MAVRAELFAQETLNGEIMVDNFPEYAVHPQIETMAQLMEAVAV